MVSINFYSELTIAVMRLFLILAGILICVDIISKSSGKLKKAVIFFLISFIPSIFYTFGRILNVEAIFTEGKFLSLVFNISTTILVLGGLAVINKLIEEIRSSKPKKGATKKIKEYEKISAKEISNLYTKRLDKIENKIQQIESKTKAEHVSVREAGRIEKKLEKQLSLLEESYKSGYISKEAYEHGIQRIKEAYKNLKKNIYKYTNII